MYTYIVYLFCKSYKCMDAMHHVLSMELRRANDLYPQRYTGSSTL